MPKYSIEKIIKKQLKWYRAEIVVLWLIIAAGLVLIPAGIGVYFYVGRLAVAQKAPFFIHQNFILSEVKMLYQFSRVLGIVFVLVGIASFAFAIDRLSLAKSFHRVVLFIKDRFEEERK